MPRPANKKQKFYGSIEDAARALRRLPNKSRYEIVETYVTKTFKIPRKVSYSYLRKIKGRKRRVRVHVSYIVYDRKRRRVKVYALSLLAQAWVTLKSYVASILKKYEIDSYDPPRKFLKWTRTTNHWWGWVKRFPPYQGAFYIVVEVWFVVFNDNSGEYFLWSRSRSKGLEDGLDWNDAMNAVRDLQKDVMKWIDGKDYLQLIEFVGWSAYPDSDWFNQNRRGRGRRG